jgi:hypothetical protein
MNFSTQCHSDAIGSHGRVIHDEREGAEQR